MTVHGETVALAQPLLGSMDPGGTLPWLLWSVYKFL